MREALADLFEKMDAAARLGVDVGALMGEIARHAIEAAEQAGETVSPLAKMMFG
jgi:hypothetical protein